jgi:DNA-directed RNA polymerase III subunit RPC8
LGFFDDIIILPHKLQHPSRFDQMEQAWIWMYKTEDGEEHDLFMDPGIYFAYMHD